MSLLGAIPLGLGSIVGFRKLRRHRRRRCPACQALMVCLAEAEDDALLEEGQQAEERVGSVDYDVWKCESCSHHFTLRYPKWFSGFAKCPQCHNHTNSSTRDGHRVGEHHAAPAARTSSSSARSAASTRVHEVLPRIESSSSSSSGSSSSSSFGGGSSGGGGASRGY